MAGEAGARGRIPRKNKVEKREAILSTVIKTSYYTVTLIVFLFAGSIIFMGIEGNHAKAKNWEHLEEKNILSEKLKEVMGSLTLV